MSATLAAVRDRLTRGVVLTGERLQETVDDAVSRGRITRDDAEDLVQRLVVTGRKQTEDLLVEIEALVSRSRSELLTAGRRAGTQVKDSGAPDRVLREVDRARRVVGIGPTFPILGYDDLTAAQITLRLSDLNRAQLRKVRDYERRNANRKSVLEAIERGLR
jgi:polyhydroxyalkanoate synthesis regulator phasin